MDRGRQQEPGKAPDRGRIGTPLKVATLVLPVIAAGTVLWGSASSPVAQDHSVPGTPSPGVSADAATPRPTATAPTAVVTETPWQEWLKHGSGVPRTESTQDIPTVAREAYTRAAAQLASTESACHLSWSLLAAIGTVESDNGQYGGARLNADGATTLPIRGIPLNGKNGTALVSDTDGGALDSDPRYDRAMGPMQILPGTWRAFGADGNGDGGADPDNIFDAALTAGRYLCQGSGDLRVHANADKAVRHYNDSQRYVDLVLALADRLRHEPTAPVAGLTPPAGPPGSEPATVTVTVSAAAAGTGTASARPGPSTTTTPSGSASAPSSPSPPGDEDSSRTTTSR